MWIGKASALAGIDIRRAERIRSATRADFVRSQRVHRSTLPRRRVRPGAGGLLGDDALCLRPFVSFGDFHGDLLAFLEGLKTFHQYRAVVNEDVLPTFHAR